MGKMLAWIMLLCTLWCAPARAEDGYGLWLRYHRLPTVQADRIAAAATAVVRDEDDASIVAAAGELVRGLSGLTGRSVMAGPVGV